MQSNERPQLARTLASAVPLSLPAARNLQSHEKFKRPLQLTRGGTKAPKATQAVYVGK